MHVLIANAYDKKNIKSAKNQLSTIQSNSPISIFEILQEWHVTALLVRARGALTGGKTGIENG